MPQRARWQSWRLHYGANDDALKLAHGLRAGLDTMNVQKA